MRSHITRPYFVPDSIPSDAEYEKLDRSFSKVFLGPAGTVTRLHNDTYHTHAWLSQIRGTKQFILYPPSQAHQLHAGEGVWSDKGSAQSWFDPLAPDYDKFPRARDATPYIAVCEPGETILVPSDWFHYAVALTPSITLMRNFMNDHNAGPFFDVWNAASSKQPPHAKPCMAKQPVPPPALPPPRQDEAAKAAAARAAAARPPPPPERRFEPSESFSGPRAGMVFQMGEKGLGYYSDTAAHAPAAHAAASGYAAVTIDHGRTVVRTPSRPLRPPALTVGPQPPEPSEGSVCAPVGPWDEPCGRRSAVAWSWRRPVLT